MSKKYKYYDFNMHFKDRESMINFRKAISIFDSTHEAGVIITQCIESNPHLFKLKFV